MLRRDLGLDQTFVVQFGRFVGNAVQGEFGLSLRQGRKVSTLIAERLPATIELSLVALIAWWSCNAFIPTVATGLAQNAAAGGHGYRDPRARQQVLP